MSMNTARVAGVGMVKFAKPGQQLGYRQMAAQAIKAALDDAGLDAHLIEQAYGAYIYGDSTAAQHAVYDVFMTGIPIINVNNNCSSGSTAIFLARQAVASGAAECVLAFGFEEMQPGALASHWDDRESPFSRFTEVLDQFGYPDAPLALRCFGAAGHHYMQTYGTSAELFAQVAVKSRKHAAANPLALFQQAVTVDEVLGAPVLYLDYLTRLMCCPPTCGAAAAIVCSPRFAQQYCQNVPVEILAQAMTTDTEHSWKDPLALVGADMTRRAAKAVYEQAGVGPDALDLVELHDCFSINEVISYEALGLCAEGEAAAFVSAGDNTYGGKVVVNPSGGLMAKGHPIGATGLAQCHEIVSQLRGTAGPRQVPGARVGLQHNLGLGGAAVVTLYRQA